MLRVARMARLGMARPSMLPGMRRMSTLPTVIDAHHHYYNPGTNQFNAFLASLGAGPYSPADYASASIGVYPKFTVHVECMPDDGGAGTGLQTRHRANHIHALDSFVDTQSLNSLTELMLLRVAVAEAAWVEELVAAGECRVGAIVANCKLPRDTAASELSKLIAAAPKLLRGIRFILDYDGPFDGKNATHIATTAPGYLVSDASAPVDYLRDAAAAPLFERGFALLAEHKLSFDLQCCPAQLPAAAALCARHPSVPVVVDHLGKPRHLAADGSDADRAALDEWRAGMELMAALPQASCRDRTGCSPAAHPGCTHAAEARDVTRRCT